METPTAPPVIPDVPPALPPEAPATPWGFWATTGLSFAIAAGFVGVQVGMGIAIGVVAAARKMSFDPETLEANGFFWGAGTVLSTIVGVGLTWLFASLRRGLKVRDYLRLKPVAPGTVWRWVIALLLLMLVTDGLTHLSGRPIVPDVMVKAYRTAGWLPLLLIAVIVFAPIGEEIFFRGFVFEGLMQSRLGLWGAILLTSLVWASIHLQYDLAGIAVIFAGGILFGYARWKTGSIYTTIVLHAVMNFLSSIQVAALVHYLGPLAK